MTDLSRLADMNDPFKAAEVNEGGFKDETPPPGTYQGLIDSFDFIEAGPNSKTPGVLYLKTVIKTIGGEYDGNEATTLHSLEDPDRFDWLKTHLERLGLETTDLDLTMLETSLSALLDVPIVFAVVDSHSGGKEYRNVYVNERIGDPMRAEPVGDAGPPDADHPYGD